MVSHLTHWFLACRDPLRWLCWGDESVVFNPVSGDTHLLNLIERAALEEIVAAGRISFERLRDQLAELLELEVTGDLEAYLESLLAQFQDVGLIAPEDP